MLIYLKYYFLFQKDLLLTLYRKNISTHSTYRHNLIVRKISIIDTVDIKKYISVFNSIFAQINNSVLY